MLNAEWCYQWSEWQSGSLVNICWHTYTVLFVTHSLYHKSGLVTTASNYDFLHNEIKCIHLIFCSCNYACLQVCQYFPCYTWVFFILLQIFIYSGFQQPKLTTCAICSTSVAMWWLVNACVFIMHVCNTHNLWMLVCSLIPFTCWLRNEIL